MGRILRWESLQLCQSLVNGLFSTFAAYAPVFVLWTNPLKEVVDVFTVRAIKQMSSFNLFIFTETEKHYLNNTIFILHFKILSNFHYLFWKLNLNVPEFK